MTHDTTRPTSVRNGLPSPPPESLAQGPRPGQPSVAVEGQHFRVRTARFSTQWLPDTPRNRHLTVVWFRLLVDEAGQPLFPLQEVAALVGSANRQAASPHREDFRQCGEDFRAFILRKRTVDTPVVDGVLHARLQTPWAGPTE